MPRRSDMHPRGDSYRELLKCEDRRSRYNIKESEESRGVERPRLTVGKEHKERGRRRRERLPGFAKADGHGQPGACKASSRRCPVCLRTRLGPVVGLRGGAR